MTVRDIVRLLGGPAQVGRALGIRSQAISMWIRKDRIPAERVPALEALARERGAAVRAEQMRPDLPWQALRGAA